MSSARITDFNSDDKIICYKYLKIPTLSGRASATPRFHYFKIGEIYEINYILSNFHLVIKINEKESVTIRWKLFIKHFKLLNTWRDGQINKLIN